MMRDSFHGASRQRSRGGSSISSRSRVLSHPRQRLRDRRAHGPATNTHTFRNFLLRKPEIVVRDDDRSFAAGKEREQPTHLESRCKTAADGSFAGGHGGQELVAVVRHGTDLLAREP